MPLTVAQVADLPDLGLLVRTAGPALDREVRWVAVSELPDPTPWIEAGDLLLTTGMALADTEQAGQAYVERLVRAEVAGVGFGVGLTHDDVPPSLVAAAERAGLPILEVPEPVPFVAVSKAVSRLLAAEEYAEAAASFESQRRMIRAALADDRTTQDDGAKAPSARIVQAVAKHIGGFALHLDADGTVLAAHPRGSSTRAAELADEVARLRTRGLLASAAVATADEHVVVLPIGAGGAPEAFLVVGSPRPLRAADQSVINLAVSLLTWAAGRPLRGEGGLDRWRALLVSAAHGTGLLPDWPAAVGIVGLDPSRAVALALLPDGVGLLDPVLARANASPGVVLAREADGTATGFAPAEADGTASGELGAIAGLPGVRALGVSRALDLTDAANVRQALAQARSAAAAGAGLRRFGVDATPDLVSLLDAATTAAWAEEYLGALGTSGEGAELMQTLRAWLGQHGQVDATAQALGIHRHTVRHRLRRAEAALGRSLDDPAVRADLWFALASARPSGG